MASSISRLDRMTGGCLCGAIRYTVNITPDITWPPTNNGTCQCTLCRKFTGALLQSSCNFPLTAITPPFSTYPSYTVYASSATGLRGFCRICGSSLTFSRPNSENCEILFGTIDEEILKSEVGSQLCLGDNNIYCENEVKGVTDSLPGISWKVDSGQEILREIPRK